MADDVGGWAPGEDEPLRRALDKLRNSDWPDEVKAAQARELVRTFIKQHPAQPQQPQELTQQETQPLQDSLAAIDTTTTVPETRQRLRQGAFDQFDKLIAEQRKAKFDQELAARKAANLDQPSVWSKVKSMFGGAPQPQPQPQPRPPPPEWEEET